MESVVLVLEGCHAWSQFSPTTTSIPLLILQCMVMLMKHALYLEWKAVRRFQTVLNSYKIYINVSFIKMSIPSPSYSIALQVLCCSEHDLFLHTLKTIAKLLFTSLGMGLSSISLQMPQAIPKAITFMKGHVFP